VSEALTGKAGNGRKRSLLAQERSRDTRQAIIRAALELWRERGYAAGADDPTAEEIAERAGISKATFYGDKLNLEFYDDEKMGTFTR